MFPPPVPKTACLGVSAPAGMPAPEPLKAGLTVLSARTGRRVIPEIPGPVWPPHLAGLESARADVLNRMLADPDIGGVICARGGFGSLAILPQINWTQLTAHPKLIMGFSDITALLNALPDRAGVVGIHGPVVTQLGDADDRTLASVTAILDGDDMIQIPGLRVLRYGDCEGRLLGGNLATFASMVGTPFFPDTEGAVLFFEDVGEPLYRIDRMLLQLMLAGGFDGIRGILLGDFTDGAPVADVAQLFLLRTALLDVPLFSGLPVGHGTTNVCLPVGARVFVCSEKRCLTCLP